MANESARYSPFLPLLGGLVPYYILVTNTAGGLMVAGGFLIAYTLTYMASLYLPTYFSTAIISGTSLLFAAVGVSLYASLVRIIDPFLYERFSHVLYLACFSSPVFQLTGVTSDDLDYDRGWERLAHGLGLSVTIVGVGLIKELIATGSVIFGTYPVEQSRTILVFVAQPSGAFILLAVLIALGRTAARGLKRSPV